MRFRINSIASLPVIRSIAISMTVTTLRNLFISAAGSIPTLYFPESFRKALIFSFYTKNLPAHKKEYTEQNRSYCADARPHGLNSSNREFLGRLCHKKHTKGKSNNKTAPPPQPLCAYYRFSFTQAESECYFHQPCKNKNYPVHKYEESI